MSENKNIYLDKLLSELKYLEESILEIRKSDSMPFSFFRETFKRTQEISHLLHKLEFMQVDDMKNQMEKLVFFLSESEKKGKVQENELKKARENELELIKDLEKEKSREIEQPHQQVIKTPIIEEKEHKEENKYEEKIELLPVEEQIQNQHVYAEGFVLPEYRNPNSNELVVPVSNQKNDNELVVPKSVNAPIHIIDIKRGVSLNDRFLFQRELFNNNRNVMNGTLEKLNSFNSYEEAEIYIKDNFSWDFENQMVNDFLSAVKKGFK